MKKRVLIWIAFAIVWIIGLTTAFSALWKSDPHSKKWYTVASFPNITNPFYEAYDDAYSIRIDKKGNVEFKAIDGETVTGKAKTVSNDEDPWHVTDISIQFQNGVNSVGYCRRNDKTQTLSIGYDGKRYEFSSKRQTEKSFASYRGQFIDFLIGVYETGKFPTKKEIAKKRLYQRFTGYYQTDLEQADSIVYDTVERVKIEAVSVVERKVSVNVGGKSVVCEIEDSDFIVASINDGQIQKMDLSEVTLGDCLVVPYRDFSSGEEVYRIRGIYCLKNGS